MSTVAETTPAAAQSALVLGRRIRALRRARGLTVEQLGLAIDRAASQISAIENGRREPALGQLRQIAVALATSVDELLRPEAPDDRARLEIEVEAVLRGPLAARLGLPAWRVGTGQSDDILHTIAALHREVERLHSERAATPEEARRANAALRQMMRERDNYFPELEAIASELLQAVGHSGGPVSHQMVADIAAHLGFSLHYVGDLPHSTRSVADRRHGRIYLPTGGAVARDSRMPVVQALAGQILGHSEPRDYADFLRQRVETNYLTAAILVPESGAVRFLTEAKNLRRIAMEDLRDVFAVSYETAAHRFTNLATARLDIPVHFTKVDSAGTIIKAYANDGVRHPTDVLGAVEGNRICRRWTAFTVFAAEDRFAPWYQYTDNPNGSYWCTARVEKAQAGEYAVSVGVPFEHVKWFRGRETTNRSRSRCPEPDCCRQPGGELTERWAGHAWPAARTPTSLLAALPTGTFPGVDESDVYRFLERHAPRAPEPQETETPR